MSTILLVTCFSPTILLEAEAFETFGGPGAAHPWLSTIEIGDHLGLPIHQEITKEALSFLNDATKTALADQHIYMEGDQSSTNHFDNCAFSGTISKINIKYRNAVLYFNPQHAQPDKAAEEFGRLLHPVQDFYSHSNWIEMGRKDLVDNTLSYWNNIMPFSYTGNDKPVFSLELPPDRSTESKIYSRSADSKVVRVKENNTSYPAVGLISGTYGDEIHNRCPSDASVPHGSVVGPYFSLADAEELDEQNVLNKDNPKRKGHAAARDLAIKQTEHEFCRLVELTRQQWKEEGVNLIYDNWVENTNVARSKCPIPDTSRTSLPYDVSNTFSNQSSMVIPSWIMQNAKWWSDGIIPDNEFASAIGFLVKEKIILVNVPFNSDGTIAVSKNLVIPGWIKNNAKWWSDGKIADSEFISGIEYMINEKIIDFSDKKVLDKAIKILEGKVTIPSDSIIYLAQAKPGTRIIEETNQPDSISLTIPQESGNYFGFYIDKMPDAKFSHPVTYAWVDTISSQIQSVDAQWPPILDIDGTRLDFSDDGKFQIGDRQYFKETWKSPQDDEKKKPVYQTSQKSLATAPPPKSIKGPSKIALVIDLGDNPPRSNERLDAAKDMFLETEDFKKYLESNGYKVNRVSQYWQNSYPYLNSSKQLVQLLQDYGKAFDCTGGCQHEFFLYLGGHGSPAKYNSTTGDLIVPGAASLYNPDGTGYNSAIWYDEIAKALASFEPCVKKIFFLDACYSGAYIVDQIERLDELCKNSPCGVTVMTGSSGREVSWIGPESSTKNFLKGINVDNDGDGVKGDLRDMYEEMKKRNKIKTKHDEETPYNANGIDSQLFLCKKDQPLCSLDGPVTMTSENTMGVHIAKQQEPTYQTPSTPAVSTSSASYSLETDAKICDDNPNDYKISASYSLSGSSLSYDYTMTITDENGNTSSVPSQETSSTDTTQITGEIGSLDPGNYYLELDNVGGKIQVTIPNPSCPTETPPVTEPGKDVVVLVINGMYYPISQFFDVQAHTPNCDAMHYHSEFPSVMSIDGTHISDPNPSTCGFGKVGLIPVDVVFMTQDQIDSFKSAMGIEP